MSDGLDPAIGELLRGSALAPHIDRPVDEILTDLGLPTLPQLPALPPLPDMPALPVIDLTALTRPLTDLASSFGTGTFDISATGIDPTKVLSDVTSALSTALETGSSALSALMSLWQGMGATGAATKSGQAGTDSAELSTQAVQEKAVLTGGATTVAVGGAEMTAVIAKYVAMVTASAPFLATPAGQIFLATATAESVTEGLAVVGKTRAEMTVHTANMTAAGQKVDVTEAPTGVDSSSQLQSVLSAITSLMSKASDGLSDISDDLKNSTTDTTTTTSLTDVAETVPADTTTIGGGGGSGVPVTGGSPISSPLREYSAPRTVGGTVTASGTGGGAVDSGSALRAASAAQPGTSAMPMGGAAGASRTAGDAGHNPAHLLSLQHGEEMVGEVEAASLPVVGALERGAQPLPDKELTL
ncbi:hypothetical protein H0264_05990 [Nocardia huaxiensis]|uniref:Uncharacterized protein n=1 Tax=Nocardia huaxiensis TaxID=2755382 RepID=A0A7D6VFP1_9NOCA|nr:hypothetical protein [Nocardia huaxiensis]QLY31857.1 hypothetical protein H0264_05990 [Nocardia huaxiensis]